MKIYSNAKNLPLNGHKPVSLRSPKQTRVSIALAMTLIATVVVLPGCGMGTTSSNACKTTTQTDANGAPISTVTCT